MEEGRPSASGVTGKMEDENRSQVSGYRPLKKRGKIEDRFARAMDEERIEGG
jgi:hypothetical protein